MRDLLEHPLVGPFWQAASEDRLCISHCPRCERDIWYPTAACSICQGELQWRTLSGAGKLIAWTTVRRDIGGSLPAPYVTGLVRPLDAPGVNLVSLLAAGPDAVLKCDLPVEARFDWVTRLDGSRIRAPIFHVTEQTPGESP